MRLLLYLLWAIRLPACPCTPTCWHPGLVAEGSAWVLEEPRVPEVGRGNCGDEKAARLILQRRKLAQRDSATCLKPHGKLTARHLLAPSVPASPLVLPAQHTEVLLQPWTPAWGRSTLTRTRRHPARSRPSSPARSCSPSATPLSWDVSTGEGRAE